MAEIVADTKRGGEVVKSLCELYRKQSGDFQPVDLNAVVEETALLLHSESIVHYVTLTTELASPAPWVNGNRIQIQQVLVNLIMNGIQAMEDVDRMDRKLHITSARHGTEAMLWIDDHGPGIDPEKIDNIFEPLATRKPGGTGMGLAIGNSIFEAHGGRMLAENRPGGGARVGFTLPVSKDVQ